MKIRRLINVFILKAVRFSTSATRYQAEKWIVPNGQRTNVSIYNPITKTKVPLVLKNWEYVTWYMCGPTVYDSAHIGHASCYVKFDIIRKILTNFFNLHVVQAMSVTDIDDKIVERAAKQGEDVSSLARTYSREFFQDMAALGVDPPSLILAVTDHITHIVAFVQALVDKQAAYAANGSVYFDTGSYDRYGKLSSVSLEADWQQHGDKRSPQDFALWKAAREGEPAWPSPWGPGRPGWHIECSAMASAVFGRSVDLHSGGIDLLFPHHENEEAQSCAYHSTLQWVNYWLHAGQLRVTGDEKMSKSLGNTVSVQQFLSRYSATQFRLFCLLSHYRQGVEYSSHAMQKAVAVSHKLESFLHDCSVAQQCPGDIDATFLLQKVVDTRQQLIEALADDFNTSKGLAAVLNLVSITNKAIHERKELGSEVASNASGVLAAVADFVRHTLAQLGVHFAPAITTHSFSNLQNENLADTEAVLDAVVQFRSQVRQVAMQESCASEVRASLLRACDMLRKDLLQARVVIKDHKQHSSWGLCSNSTS